MTHSMLLKYINAHKDLLAAKYTALCAATVNSTCADKKVAAAGIYLNNSALTMLTYTNGGTADVPCLCTLKDKYTCIHAEINLLMSVAAAPDIIMITKPPCVTCAAAIINAGVHCVLYGGAYSSNAGINLLQQAGVTVLRIDVNEVLPCSIY